VLSSAIAGATGLQRRRKQRQAGLPVFTRQLMPVPTLYGRWFARKRPTHFGLTFPIQNLFSEITFVTQNPLSRVLDPTRVAGYVWGSGWPPAGVPPVHLLQGGRPRGPLRPLRGLGKGPAGRYRVSWEKSGEIAG
jgi:hypothetical protein